MKLTLSVGYAVGVLLQICQRSDDGPVTAAVISRGCRFPPRFLYRILRRLVDAGLLSGTSGPGGGYALARRPEQITLLDIAGGVEGPPEPSVLEPVCSHQRPAVSRVNDVCRRNAERFADDLKQISLADLDRLSHSRRRSASRGR
jgi:Rrf2 family iron-sulfur cluster assembly transcriptional regulator